MCVRTRTARALGESPRNTALRDPDGSVGYIDKGGQHIRDARSRESTVDTGADSSRKRKRRILWR